MICVLIVLHVLPAVFARIVLLVMVCVVMRCDMFVLRCVGVEFVCGIRVACALVVFVVSPFTMPLST